MASLIPNVVCYGALEVVNRVQAPRMPTPDRPSEATADYYRPGGTAFNIALALATWGVRTSVLGNQVGEDAYADLIGRELERHPLIQTQWLQRSDHVRTPFTRIFVMPDRERYTIRYWHNEMRWTEVGAGMLAGAGYLSTDAEAGQPGADAARLAHAMGLKVVTGDAVDPGHPLAGLSHVIVTSATFLRRARPDFTLAQLPDLAAQLLAAGAGLIIVTNGSEPVQAFARDGASSEFASFPLPPVDRTGAGDIFKAACLLGLLRGWDLDRYARFGAAAAALWIDQPSPFKHPPTLGEIEALLDDHSGASVPRLAELAPELSEQQHVCPLCQRPVAASLFEKHWQMSRQVVERLRRNFPGWRRTDGACPRCIHEQQAEADRQQRADVPLLLPDHPIYGKPDLFVLPTPVRLRANPHYTGKGITICFLDSGFYPHPDLTQPENRIVAMVDATTDEIVEGVDFREPRLVSWHGLMTSVAAAGNGGLSQGRYAGIASSARVVLVKISDPHGRVRERDITRGLRWLLANHERYDIRIANLSVGGDRSGLGRNSVIDGLVKHLVSQGVVVVAAAGNAGHADLFPPASAPEAITVGGIDDRNVLDPTQHRMYRSNWGRAASGDLKPEVVAPSIWLAAPILPGTKIAEQNLLLDRLWRASDGELAALLASTYQVLDFAPALLNEPLTKQRQAVREKMVANKFVTPYYQHVDGTSFSAPIVSSVAAQMLEANPHLTPTWVKGLIVMTASRLAHEPEERQGYGVITPGRAVAAGLRERFGALEEAPLSPCFDEQGVHFIFYDRRARQVAVVGDFNDWNPAAAPMQNSKPWQWRATLPQPAPGRYHYKFLIDGERWMDDPENAEKEADGFGGVSGVLVVT